MEGVVRHWRKARILITILAALVRVLTENKALSGWNISLFDNVCKLVRSVNKCWDKLLIENNWETISAAGMNPRKPVKIGWG